MFKVNIGDIVTIQVKVTSKTEEEGGKVTYKVKGVSSDSYNSMTVGPEDIMTTAVQVPHSKED